MFLTAIIMIIIIIIIIILVIIIIIIIMTIEASVNMEIQVWGGAMQVGWI